MLVGADGCPKGWLAAILHLTTGQVETRVLSTDELLALDAKILAIDMPIGLSEDGPRDCDVLARKRIGPRGACLFPSPVRGVLNIADYHAASARSKELCGKALSKQSHAIFPKIRELDAALRTLDPKSRDRVWETHPEVVFAEMSGNGTLHHALSKHKLAGHALRRRLLESEFDPREIEAALARHRKSEAAPDDILDAFACLWTAARIHGGSHKTVTDGISRDATGLRMTIAY